MKTLLQPLLMAVLTVTAADAQPAPKPNEPAGTSPFSLTVTLRPRRIARVGDPVNLDILLTNTSGRDLEIRGRKGGQGSADGDQIDVRDAQGNEIQRKESTPQSEHLVRFYDQFMESGGSGLDYIRLDTHYDLSKPGQYTISVQRPDAASGVIVKSNTVTLTISEDPPPPPFSVTLSAIPSAVKAGDPVLLDINLTNTSGEEWRLLGRPAPKGEAANYKLDIRDSQGQTVLFRKRPPTRPTRQGYAGTLAPGQSDHDSIRLDEYFDLSKPGTYSVSAQRSDPDTKTVATSNTITLTIVGPPGQAQQ